MIVNSLSGGRTSSYMAVHYPTDVNIFACVCIDFPSAAPKDPAVLRYCEEKLNGNFIASSESVKTLKVLMLLEQKIGKEIVWVRGISFDELIDREKFLPTWARRFCTTNLKILPIFKYLYFKYGVVREQIGFRLDEAHRAYKKEHELSIIEVYDLFGDIQEVKNYVKKNHRKTKSIIKDYPISTNIFGSRRNNLIDIHWADKEYPMIDDLIEHLVVLNYWKGYSEFDFPIESNCQGCPNKNSITIKNQFAVEPDVMNWFALQEHKEKIKSTWHDDKIRYDQKREMNFTDLMDLQSESCNDGGCNDE